MERPALQQLFQEMEGGKIDAVVSVNQSLDTESPQVKATGTGPPTIRTADIHDVVIS